MAEEKTKERADELVLKGKKLIKSWNPFVTGKQEKAGECFQKAANLYKMIKYYAQAAECFTLMVSPHLKLDCQYDAANDWLSAAQMFEKVDGHQEDGINALTNAVQIFLELGKFNRAAKAEEKLGDILEEQENFEEAIKHYQKGETYFDNSNLSSSAIDCKKKVAHLYTLMENYKVAINLFEEIGDFMIKDKCLKWNAKEYHFKSCLCHFLQAGGDLDEEIENVKENFERYKDKDVHFEGSDYDAFIEKVIESFENQSIKEFSLACKKFDDRLDTWTTKVALRIKKNFETAWESNK